MTADSSSPSVGTGANANKAEDSAKGFSQFLGKVLGQLSLSSWLPSAMLVGNLAILLQLFSTDKLNVGRAILDLTAKPLGILVVLLFALILGAIITQAFQFEIIRSLEGYLDLPFAPVRGLIGARIRRHRKKRQRLEKTLDVATKEAFVTARARILDEVEDPDEVRPALDILEDELYGRTISKGRRKKHGAAAEVFDWLTFCAPGVDYQLGALTARATAYPAEYRILPTRLGNILRSSEDEIKLDQGEDLEGYVMRNYSALPVTLQEEHKDYRNRLDMYCSLMLTFCVLGIVACITLQLNPSGRWYYTVAVSAAYFFLAGVSYEAALSSARGYGQVLREINTKVQESRAAKRLADEQAVKRSPLGLLHRQLVTLASRRK